jgi:hypothetical protein
MQLKDMPAAAVMEEMDRQQPQWWLNWADQQDLRDAMTTLPEHRIGLLKNRAQAKVMLVMRSAYVVSLKE